MGTVARRAWAQGVQAQLERQTPTADRFVVFAGERYREFLMAYFRGRGAAVDVPLEGLRIGEQLNWLGQHAAHKQSH